MLRHRASAASLIIETTQTKPAIETLKRITLARASRTSFVQVLRHRALARLRAPTPHRPFRIESPYHNTKSISQQSRARPAFPGERSKYALDIRRNASRVQLVGGSCCVTISRFLYINIIPQSRCGELSSHLSRVSSKTFSTNPLRNARAERLLRELFPA